MNTHCPLSWLHAPLSRFDLFLEQARSAAPLMALSNHIVFLKFAVFHPTIKQSSTCVLIYPYPQIYFPKSVEQDQPTHTCSLILLFTLCFFIFSICQQNPIKQRPAVNNWPVGISVVKSVRYLSAPFSLTNNTAWFQKPITSNFLNQNINEE